LPSARYNFKDEMNMKINKAWLTAAAALLISSVAFAATNPSSPNAQKCPQATPQRAFVTVKELMDAIIDPSADTFWDSVGTISDQNGTRDLAPKTDEEWANVRRAIIRVIEGANLLMIPGRHAAPAGEKSAGHGELTPKQIEVLINKNRAGFDGYAQALQAIGIEALRAIDTKNVNAMMEIGGRIDTACESCHMTYWYPKQKS
jgi:hypothetical protein